jgi:hypothetical protein
MRFVKGFVPELVTAATDAVTHEIAQTGFPVNNRDVKRFLVPEFGKAIRSFLDAVIGHRS